MKKLDLILIDSFQEEYYKYCPFLSDLRKKYFSADLMPIIGYQQQLASLFSGKWPQEIDVWNTFKFSPKTSIFKWINPFSFLKIFDNKLPKYFIDFISYFFVGISDMIAARIPIRVMSKFDIILRKPIISRDCLKASTIFDLFRNNKINFSYFKGGLEYTHKSNKFLLNLRHLISRSDCYTLNAVSKDSTDFKFIYLMELDCITHKFGINSLQVRNKLKEIDNLLKKYLEKSNRPFIIISDHGMVRVDGTIDIASRINSLGLVLGKDYLVFFESVIARFWFFNDEAKEKIINELKKIKEGHILDRKEKQEFGIDFRDNKFGDLFFVLEPGKVIIPNYYQIKGGVKAMHGYLPQFNKGVFLTSLEINNKQVRTVDFIDIAPIIADFFNLSKISSKGNLFGQR